MTRLVGGLRAKGMAINGKPLVSVVTVCLNTVNTLERTIQSIINQDYPDIEHIIIDGGSKDGTLDIIHKYDNHTSYWVSEKDEGISDAFNKGFLLSTGNWISFLNAGDVYCDRNAIHSLMEYSGQYDIVYGGLKGIRKKDNKPNYYHAEDVSGDIYWLKNAVPHQSCIVSRRVFNKIGLFDKHMRFAMDYEHFLRAYKNGFKFKAVERTITQVVGDGVSAVFWKEQLKELWLAQNRYDVLPFLRFFYYCERFLRTYMYWKLGYF